MLGLHALTQCVKHAAAQAVIDALRQRGIGPQTDQPPSIPGLNGGAVRRLW